MPGEIQQFPLISGVHEDVDPRAAPAGTITSLKNCVWSKNGRIEKRNGTTALPKARTDSGNVTTGKRLITRGAELGIIDGSELFSFSSELGQWAPVGQVPECGLEWETLVSPVDGVQASDAGITSDGKLVQAWVTGDPTITDLVANTAVIGNLYVRITDRTTGATIVAYVGHGAAAQANYCRVLVSGSRWGVVLNVETRLILLKDDFTTVTLRTDGDDSAFNYTAFDACVVASTFVVAYQKSSGTNRLKLYSYDFDGAQVATSAVVGTHSTVSAVGVHGTDGEFLYVIYSPSSGTGSSKIYVAVNDPTSLVPVTAEVLVDGTADMFVNHVGVCRLTDSSAVVAWSAHTRSAGTSYASGTTITKVVTSAGSVSDQRASLYTKMLSQPFVLGGIPYVFLSDFSANRDLIDLSGVQNPFPGNNSYLVAIETNFTGLSNLPHRLVGKVDVLISGSWTQGFSALPDVASAHSVAAILPFTSEAPVRPYVWLQGTRLATVTTGPEVPEDSWVSVELGGEAHLAAASLTSYDGRRPFDFIFPRTTPIGFNSTVVGGSGSGSIVAGNYQYAIVPVYRSAAGMLHRGPPSPALQFTVGSGGRKVTLAILQQTLGWKGTSESGPTGVELLPVLNELYRTEINGSAIHKLTVEPTDGMAINIPYLPQNSFVDSVADNDISSSIAIPLAQRPLIYTTSELEDMAPPSVVTLHLHQNRLWAISGDRKTVWYSKDYEEDPNIAPGFHPDAVLVFDQNLVGMGTIDDKLIIFAEESIWYVIGQGPARNGDGSDYSPTKIQTDVGCISARSIVSVPDGVMFQSSRGIYMLSRSLELTWVGWAVRDTLASFPVVTSSVLVHALNHVRFSCNKADGSEGVVLNFDHLRKQWSVFEYSDGATARTPIADATLFNETWTFLTPAGKVYQEDSTKSLDGSTWVASDWETAWFSGDGPISYTRMRRAYIMGERLTDCDLTIRVGSGFSSSYAQTRTWISDALSQVDGVNVGVHIKNQKTELRLRVTDAAPTGAGAVVGTGRGANYSMMGVEVFKKPGMDKRPAIARK